MKVIIKARSAPPTAAAVAAPATVPAERPPDVELLDCPGKATCGVDVGEEAVVVPAGGDEEEVTAANIDVVVEAVGEAVLVVVLVILGEF